MLESILSSLLYPNRKHMIFMIITLSTLIGLIGATELHSRKPVRHLSTINSTICDQLSKDNVKDLYPTLSYYKPSSSSAYTDNTPVHPNSFLAFSLPPSETLYGGEWGYADESRCASHSSVIFAAKLKIPQ